MWDENPDFVFVTTHLGVPRKLDKNRKEAEKLFAYSNIQMLAIRFWFTEQRPSDSGGASKAHSTLKRAFQKWRQKVQKINKTWIEIGYQDAQVLINGRREGFGNALQMTIRSSVPDFCQAHWAGVQDRRPARANVWDTLYT